ncbi:putative oxidoreductase C-terminal domain-containing protein [Sunxiuqinia dokdonensis]|uniref:Oxidoreductase n=1 Tax=Sunxiuqinia dokdonensis TaxID=1409788 RepID=A0A0L8V2R1_9BACT|nr:putative oxidoreductase C-terminal domain-containing protein [Sunxiuqinia dokdonensis]KOH42638.1 oxidoreductase [Sunxiuqinia dokdonensis]
MTRPISNGLLAVAVLLSACSGGSKQDQPEEKQSMFTGAKNEVKLMTLDPGHFHAALVQKTMYDQIDPTVYIYAPEGEDVQDHLNRIEGFNTRADNPTSWVSEVYTGDDYLEKMLAEKPGNVMMVSGNNAKKTEYIKAAAAAGINIFADKPMAINTADFALLEESFKAAEANDVLLYDIMTERYEITTIIQRELSMIPEVFGQLKDGTAEEPSITKESVHHIFKYVAGNPLKRPDWFFDTEQQGEGMVDVTTHLVDMIQWEAFPEQVLQKSDVEMVSASRWTTELSLDQFQKVTQKDAFPDFLQKDVVDGKLQVYTNGEFTYKLKGKYAKVSVIWDFQAPEGAGDTHYSIMRGSLCDVIIKQGEAENYKPTVYVRATADEGQESFEGNLQQAVSEELASQYPGLELVKLEDKLWTINIPEEYKVGHEAHFAQVTEKYLDFLTQGQLPEWEVPNMITKYYTTTQALEMAKK